MAENPFVVSLNDMKAHCILYLKDNKALIVGTDSKKLLKILPPYTRISDSTKTNIGIIESMAEATSGEFWASGSFTDSQDIEIILYSSTLEVLKNLTGHKDTVIGLAFNSTSLYSASEDCSVKLWHKSSSVGVNLYTHDSPIITFDLSQQSELIASSDTDNVFKVFSLKNSQELWTSALDEKLWSLKFLPGKNLVVCGDHSGRLVGLDYMKRIEEFALQVHESRIRSVWIHDRFVVTGSFDNRVGVSDCITKKVVASFECHNDWIRSVAANEKFIFSAGDDSAVVTLAFDFCSVRIKAKKETERKSWNSVYPIIDDVKSPRYDIHDDLLDIHKNQDFDLTPNRDHRNFRSSRAASFIGGSLLLAGLIGVLVFFGFN